MIAKDQFELKHEMDKIDFTYHPDNPYQLHYHGYGNYEGCRCEGNINKKELEDLIRFLQNISCRMVDEVHFRGEKLTKADIPSLREALEKLEKCADSM